MALVGASPVYRPPVAGEPLRLREDGHWSTDGLVAGYYMNAMRGGIVQDVSGFENHGTLVGGPTWVPGKDGGAVSFDGVNQCVNVGLLPGVGPAWNTAGTVIYHVMSRATSEAWIWGTYTPGTQALFHATNRQDTTGITIFFRANVVDTSRFVQIYADGVLPQNEWHHVAVSWTGLSAADIALYVDGAAVALRTVADRVVGALEDFASDYRIGAGTDVTGNIYNPMDCIIADYTIYNRALSAYEIAALHAAPDLPIWRPRAGISLIGLPALWLLDGDAQTTGAADAQATRIMLPHADAGARGDAEVQAARTFGTRGDAQATGVVEATVTRTLTAAGDAQATAAAEATATRVVLLYVDAASQSDAEAGAALTHGATGDAAAGGNAEAAAGAVLLITGDALAEGFTEGAATRTFDAAGDAATAGNAEAAATIAHLLYGDAFATGAAEAQATHLIYAVGDAAATAGAEAQAALLLIVTGDAAASALAEATPSLAASLDGDAAGMAGASGIPQIAYLLHGDAQAISSAAEEQLVRAVLLPIAATDVQRLVVEATALARTGIGAAQLSRDELSADSLATLRVIADELRRHGINVDLL